MRKRIEAPCFQCEERSERCHSTCERYLEYRSYRDDLNKERYERNEDEALKFFRKMNGHRPKNKDLYSKK